MAKKTKKRGKRKGRWTIIPPQKRKRRPRRRKSTIDREQKEV
ncbi:MAG: hypothetical protein ABIN54_09120 [candidate division WOR-3 bacterium]